MKQEDKDLLLKDLCARLPYGVKVKIPSIESSLTVLSINTNGVTWVTRDTGYPFEIDWENCKPYLFPLSSMTEEQRKEYESLCIKESSECTDLYGIIFTKDYYYDTVESIDYLYKNHIDIRDLIPKNLVIVATGLNIY